MTTNENKGISNITYNHLNLPVEISLNSGVKLKYTWLAKALSN